jgi:hypothetical protein
VEKRVCLSCDVLVVNATRRAATRIEVGVRDLVRRIVDDQAQVGYSVARRLGGRVTSCAIHIVHMEEMASTGFSV